MGKKAHQETLTSPSGKTVKKQNVFVREASSWKKAFKENYELYILILPVIAYFIIFYYIPMYGIQIAFKDYSPALGIEASEWVGLKHLTRFFNSHYFWRLITNTLGMSVYGLLISIPAPIILALLFTEVRAKKLRVTMQAISYAPNFISVVVASGMLIMFLAPDTGFIGNILVSLGADPTKSALSDPNSFWHIFVWSNVWQSVGWSSVIYTAAIEGVPPELYEAAKIDGASRLKQVRYITIPSIMPTIIILSILAVGSILSVGSEKLLLLQNDNNIQKSEVISTYVYQAGLQNAQYSFASMIGLFNNIINFAVLFMANMLAKKAGETSLW